MVDTLLPLPSKIMQSMSKFLEPVGFCHEAKVACVNFEYN
jgi:hypothetical protein